MNEYKEIENKLVFRVTSSNKSIFLKVDCEYGTIAYVSYYNSINKLTSNECGEKTVIGSSSQTRGKSIDFNGSSVNPEKNPIRVIHTIYEEGGNTLIYIFPDDYTGSPEFDENDDEPSYLFNVNFI